MMKKIIALLSLIILVGCTSKQPVVRVEARQTAPKSVVPKPIRRSEPIFYNGKIYRVNLTPDVNGVYDVSIGGMSAGQQKDAVAVATSAVRYFGCPDGKTGLLTNAPQYQSGKWDMAARCG
jgi:hypothetical protein